MIFNDSPIETPADDRFGVEPFTASLARSIAGIRSPEGVVIALNGPWGSGKSSAVNLVLHHLSTESSSGAIKVIRFNPWWFSGSENLTLAFFQELRAAFEQKSLDKAKTAARWLGERLSSSASLLTAAVNYFTSGAGGDATAATLKIFGDLLNDKKTVDEVHKSLTEELREQSTRFLVAIDDIDRLAPDDALSVFRLIKSIGRLPNVVYLLAFDRELAERIVEERFPSEGSHYLEKIVQASFDLPLPEPDELRQIVLSALDAMGCVPEEKQIVRFMNLFYDLVAPYLRTPRNAIRLISTLGVTWPAVKSEVDAADFLGIETLRLFEPAVFRAIRANPGHLCGISERGRSRNREEHVARYDALLLSEVPEARREHMRRALQRLFPRMESVWRNTHYGNDWLTTWRRHRLVCSPQHFPTYFRFSLGDEASARGIIAKLIANAGDPAYVRNVLTRSVGELRRSGHTRASLLLDELMVHAPDVADKDVPVLITTLFELGDTLHNAVDDRRGPDHASNELRLHWLMNRFLRERFSLERRAAIVLEAAQPAALGWLVDFASRCKREHEPNRDGEMTPDEDRFTTSDVALTIVSLALARIRAAAKSGELIAHRELSSILFRWREFSTDAPSEVQQWITDHLIDGGFVLRLAAALTTKAWTHGFSFDGMGDRVALGTSHVHHGSLEALVDVDAFFAEITRIEAENKLSQEELMILTEFRAGWQNGSPRKN